MAPSSAASRKPRAAEAGMSAIERKFHALGLREQQDFILHLPLRYEDETRVTPIARLRPGFPAQVEGDILRSEILYRPRRQLTAIIADDTGELQLRWLNFYGSQHKQLTAGRRLRARGEVRGGLWGREMVHPRMSNADTPLSLALTPVYPSTEGLPQPTLRKAIDVALRQSDLSDTLPDGLRERYDLQAFEPSIRLLHAPPPGVAEADLIERAHPAWRRIKFDELLAQQLSLAAARAGRRSKQAQPMPASSQPGNLAQRLRAALPFDLTQAQQRVCDEIS